MPYERNPHHEIETLRGFNYLNLFKPNEHSEDYHNRGPNDKSFLFQVKDNEYVYVGEKVISFEINEKIVSSSSERGFIDIKFPFAYSDENIYFMLHQKKLTIQEYETSTEKKPV